jgi:hypothetical protein
MSVRRWLLVLVGVGIWAFGIATFVGVSYVGGGVLVLAGGLCLVVAAAGGWSEFFEGLTNWLLFWR